MNEHATAIRGLLEQNEHLTVYDGPPRDGDPRRDPPYVVFYVHVPYENRDRLNQTETDETWISVVTHSVGATMEAARIVARNVRAALLDQIPDVAGWICYRITHGSSPAPTWDNSTGQVVADQVDEWEYRCKPELETTT